MTQSFSLNATTWLGLVVFAAGSTLASAQTKEWLFHKTADGLHPDGDEQQLVWLMNRARSNPDAEGAFLAASDDSDIEAGIRDYRVDLATMRAEFSATAAKPPATFDRRLYEGSRAHALDLIARVAEDHDGQFGQVITAGFSFATARISVAAYNPSALYTHALLNLDWGPSPDGMQAGRGHRAGIMSIDASVLSNVGFAVIPESNPATPIGPLVFCGAYASANPNAPDHFNRFLTGTVWADANRNNRYDPGEGLSDIRVQPNTGDWHAITGVAGGWAVPVSTPGEFSLTFSGASLNAPLTRQATVGNASALIDVRIPAPIALQIVAIPSGQGVRLEWIGGTAPYQIQSSPDLSADGWKPLGPPTVLTSQIVEIAQPRAFFRVVGSP